MNKIVNKFDKIMNISLLVVLLNVVVGFLLIMFSNLSTKLVMVVIGCLILVNGLFSLIKYFYDGLANNVFKVNIIDGIADVIISVFVIFNIFNFDKMLAIGFGLWQTFKGIINVVYAYKFYKSNEDIYSLVGFIGILMVIMGIVTIINPFSRFMILTKLIGIFTVCYGLFEGMVCNLFKKRNKYILKIYE